MDGVFGLGKVVLSLLNFSNIFSQAYEANRVRPLAGVLSNLATQLGVTAEELLGKSSAKRAAGKQGPRPDFDAATADRSLAQTKQRVISQLLDSVIAAHRQPHTTAPQTTRPAAVWALCAMRRRIDFLRPSILPINYLRPF